ncbi:MAG: hypothetical protein Tsb0034_09360 [Ekhidna sp.]
MDVFAFDFHESTSSFDDILDFDFCVESPLEEDDHDLREEEPYYRHIDDY